MVQMPSGSCELEQNFDFGIFDLEKFGLSGGLFCMTCLSSCDTARSASLWLKLISFVQVWYSVKPYGLVGPASLRLSVWAEY